MNLLDTGKPKNIVIIAAHPDDEVLGCGATAALLAQCGHRITPLIICENATVRYAAEMRANLENWSHECAAILGIDAPVFAGLPDQKLDTFSALEMAQTIEKLMAPLSPDIVFTHHGGDINKDHRVLFEATMVATRPLPGQRVQAVYTYETISSTEWSATGFYDRFLPNTFFDISNTLSQKIEAFSRYRSEVRDFPHPRSLQGIEIRAKDWGARVGLNAAEPFQLVRQLMKANAL